MSDKSPFEKLIDDLIRGGVVDPVGHIAGGVGGPADDEDSFRASSKALSEVVNDFLSPDGTPAVMHDQYLAATIAREAGVSGLIQVAISRLLVLARPEKLPAVAFEQRMVEAVGSLVQAFALRREIDSDNEAEHLLGGCNR